ncbi:MAG: DNRLRE domain-containing protein [Candidatus Limnocylindrales bacterium]
MERLAGLSRTRAAAIALASVLAFARLAGPGHVAPVRAADDPVLVGAGDIATCDFEEDEATARLLDDIPGTVFTLGDNAYDSGRAAEFRDCYGPTWGRHRARTRPAAGNHDYLTAGAGPYFDYFGSAAGVRGQGWYSYDVGAWHVVVLNSNCSDVGGCGRGSPQLAWLKADLAAYADAHVLAYWHHPRFSSRAPAPVHDVRPLWEVLYDAGADVVLSGHSHDYERFALQDPWARPDPTHGIRAFVVGTGGAWLRPKLNEADNSEVWASAHGVLALTLRADAYDWRFVPIAGGTFTDAGSDTPHGRPPPRTRRTFAAHTDTWVDEGAPNTTHGASPRLRVDGNHGGGDDYRSYLKVRATGLSGTVFRAAVRIWVTNPTRDGPAIFRTSTRWSSRTLTWRNRPGPIGGSLDDAGPVPSGSWMDFDVTEAVTGNGTYAFLLRSTSGDGLVASSEQGAHPPRLVVETIP